MDTLPAARQRGLEGTETGPVDVQYRDLAARLVLAEAHGAQFGRREDRRRHEIQIRHPGLLAIGAVGKGMSLADGHGRQRDRAGHVPHRMNAGHIGACHAIDQDLAPLSCGHSDRRQPQPCRGRPASGGDQHLIHVQMGVIVQGDADRAVRLPLQALERALQAHVDALLTVSLDDQVGHAGVETAQHPRSAMDLRDLCPEAVEDAGKLDADIAATDDGDATRKGFQVEDLVRADRQLGPRQLLGRGHHRLAPGGDQDLACPDLLSGRKPDPVWGDDAGVLGKARHAGLVQVAGIGGFQPADFLVLGGHQRRPVEGGGRHLPAESAGFLESLRKARGKDQQLLGHAAADDAGAPEAETFGNAHPGTVLGGDPCRPHPSRAATDHKEVEFSAHSFKSCRQEFRGKGHPCPDPVIWCRISGRPHHPGPAGCSCVRPVHGRWRR